MRTLPQHPAWQKTQAGQCSSTGSMSAAALSEPGPRLVCSRPHGNRFAAHFLGPGAARGLRPGDGQAGRSFSHWMACNFVRWSLMERTMALHNKKLIKEGQGTYYCGVTRIRVRFSLGFLSTSVQWTLALAQ